MTTKIPYVISEAHPDYKRPYVLEDFGTIDENVKDTFFVEKVAEFICDRTDCDDIKSVDDIREFWENYYDEYYMDNSPWDARIFINGEWENAFPSNVEVFECIKRMNVEIESDTDKNTPEKEDLDYEEELLNWELTDEEANIQLQMEEYMKTELDKSDLEAMSTMNQTDQIIYILSKCMLNISSDKYKKNRELFYKFLNIILRFTEKDIAVTTEEMTKNHDEKISLKLNYLMNVYGSLIAYNNIFKSFQT